VCFFLRRWLCRADVCKRERMWLSKEVDTSHHLRRHPERESVCEGALWRRRPLVLVNFFPFGRRVACSRGDGEPSRWGSSTTRGGGGDTRNSPIPPAPAMTNHFSSLLCPLGRADSGWILSRKFVTVGRMNAGPPRSPATSSPGHMFPPTRVGQFYPAVMPHPLYGSNLGWKNNVDSPRISRRSSSSSSQLS
jgi:hypothetical protein